LAQTQASLIDAHRTEDLLDVLARRQALIDEFTLSHGQMTQLTQRLDESLQRAHPDQRLRIQALIDEIGESLAKVMSTDHADQQSLSRSKDQMKQELGSMDAAKQARNAYLGPRQRNPRFADRRG
jgi:hypothetical protein